MYATGKKPVGRRSGRLFGRLLLLLVGATTLVATAFTLGASAAAPPGAYANGFESAANVDFATYPNEAMSDVTRVASGSGGITSASGGWHAVSATDAGSFTRYGGYSSAFPTGGYTTSIAIYLDMAASPLGSDVRFDWSSAISNASGNHRRDFVFNVGTDGLGGFVMSASNNAPGWPANPGNNPLTITTPGWYTFQHTFRDAGAGVLAVDMSVRSGSTVLRTWTLSDPSDVIGTTVGGNRYGWMVDSGFGELALDDITRSGVVCTPTGFYRDGINLTAAQIGGAVTGPLDATGCNIGAYNPTSVNNADISGANYYGVVVNGESVNVTNSLVHNIGEVPLNGSQHGNAVLYINGAHGTISGNTVSRYQKNGITVSGNDAANNAANTGTSVTVQDNTVTGEGPINYIAQNGIQISYGATAKVIGNDVSRNNYAPSKVTACGLLIYKAAGVSSTKTGLSFIKADNNFHGNEEDICNFGKGGGFSPTP
jgi:hypothetical protein